jgi:hypothetical protein
MPEGELGTKRLTAYFLLGQGTTNQVLLLIKHD